MNEIYERDYIVHNTFDGPRILYVVLKVAQKLKCNYWNAYDRDYGDIDVEACKKITERSCDGEIELPISLITKNIPRRFYIVHASTLKNRYRIGDTIYRIDNPNDGGGWAPTYMTVKNVDDVSITASTLLGVQYVFHHSAENSQFYSSYGKARNECCKLNGYRDSFDFYCKTHGIPDDEQEENIQRLMDINGVTTYNALLEVL